MRVMSVPLLANFRPWQIKAYSGTTDPQDHLSKFYASMEAAAAPDEVKCRCFLATLEGFACDWFNWLPKGTIDDWDTLAEKFVTHFAANRRQRDVHGADDQALVAMFQAALPRGEVRKELRKNPPPTYQETLARAKFLASEEFDDAPDSEAAKRAPADSGEIAKKRKKKKDYTAGPRTSSAGVYSVGASVGMGRELALSPLPHLEAYVVSSGSKYCEYHRNNTHNTKEYFTPQKEMQRLIARGPAPRDDGAAPSRGPPEGRTWRKPTEPVVVAMQARNPEKRHIGRECDDLDEDEAQGYPVMEKDLPNTPSPHWDALVVRIEINDAIVHRTLVDTGSSVNVMYEKTFQDLGLNRKDLRPVRTPLSGFTRDSIEAEGVITMPVIVGDGAHKAKLKMEFMIVSINCAHNMILGRPGLEDLECVISPYYLCMKFPTPLGIGVARGDQKLARSCYVRITKKLPRDEMMVVHAHEEMRKLEGRSKAEPAEDVEEVLLDPRAPERKVKIGASLTGSQRKHLMDVLAAYRMMFAWGPGDMPGVDPKIICHRLVVNPESRPVKQKKRFLSSERREFVAKEIEFKPRLAIKGQALADFMVECTAREEPRPEEPEADDSWTVFTDGSSAAKNSGGGVVVIAPEGFRAYYPIRFGFKASNNEAEYEALRCGLRLAAGMNATKLRVKCDSKLVVGHVSGEFETKDERMKKYTDTALELLKSFTTHSVENIPRAENAEEDILLKLSSDTPEHIRRMANVEELSELSIHAFPVAMICARPRDWTDDIVAFLKDGYLPDNAMKAKLVRTRAPGYTLEGEKLYKRAYHSTLLRCLRPTEAEQVMGEVHAGICSAHQGAYAVSRKITLQAYFWQTIVKDYAEFVKKCKVCQEFQKVPGRPSTNYTPINTAIPFARWGVDLVGTLPREPALTESGCLSRTGVEHSCLALLLRRKAERGPHPDVFPGWRSTFALGAPHRKEGRAQTMPGCFSRMKVKHSRSALLLERMVEHRPYPDAFPEWRSTFTLGAPPQEEGRAQTIPGCFSRMEVNIHARRSSLEGRPSKDHTRMFFPDEGALAGDNEYERYLAAKDHRDRMKRKRGDASTSGVVKDIILHVYRKGFDPTYLRWKWHGELENPCSSSYTHNEQVEDDSQDIHNLEVELEDELGATQDVPPDQVVIDEERNMLSHMKIWDCEAYVKRLLTSGKLDAKPDKYDILLMGNDVPTLSSVKTWLSKNLSMKDLVDASYDLGIGIYSDRSRKLIGLSEKEEKKRMENVPYVSAIGSIIYSMICTTPDVAYALCITSRYQSNPGDSHWMALMTILKYLRRTKDSFLVYGEQGELRVTGYTDASFQTDMDDFNSQVGYVYCLNGRAVSWKSYKQDTIADSATEAGCMVASEVPKEGVWIKNFLTKLGVVPSSRDPIPLFCDNTRAVAQAKEPWSHQKTKHIVRRYHIIREILECGDVEFCKIGTDDSLAYLLTKALGRIKYEGHISSMSIREMHNWP
ncbi:unnamed protein product [Cuscuta campestris]|uniref:RNase H type-1 domain-containing protein n=1 Tax=Cuscuta campestris TaxID=132261 RepID=A0A484NTI2_9ASTE|nr:unnamed protein product [Cuscuta campestris]